MNPIDSQGRGSLPRRGREHHGLGKGTPAGPPIAPTLTGSARRAGEQQRSYLQKREIAERRSMLRGLIVLALFVLIFAALHSGVSRAFPAGWWRQW